MPVPWKDYDQIIQCKYCLKKFSDELYLDWHLRECEKFKEYKKAPDLFLLKQTRDLLIKIINKQG